MCTDVCVYGLLYAFRLKLEWYTWHASEMAMVCELFAIAAFFPRSHTYTDTDTPAQRVANVCECAFGWRSLFTAGAAVAVAAAAACHPSHATALSIQFSCAIDTYTYIRTKWNEMRLLPTIPKWLHLHTNQAEQQQQHTERAPSTSRITHGDSTSHTERERREYSTFFYIYYMGIYIITTQLRVWHTFAWSLSKKKLYFRESFILLAFFLTSFSSYLPFISSYTKYVFLQFLFFNFICQRRRCCRICW